MLMPRLLWVLSFVSVAVFLALNVMLLSDKNKLPKIQGIVVPEARNIDAFTLVTHRGELFSNANLKGKWSLISYGFTDCPDICPTTLSKLSVMKNQLERNGKADDLQILFYTVDPERDTVEQLSDYISFFDKDFVALTYGLELGTEHVPFQRSLGIVSAISPLAEEEAKYDYKGYSVSHGVVLYLINPEGRLQAILKPRRNAQGLHYFEIETLQADYLALRQYFG